MASSSTEEQLDAGVNGDWTVCFITWELTVSDDDEQDCGMNESGFWKESFLFKFSVIKIEETEFMSHFF